MNKQQTSKIKKKSSTKLFNKIIFPFNNITPKSPSNHQAIPFHQGIHESQKLKNSNQNPSISNIKRSKTQKKSFNQLNKLIEQFQKRDKKQLFNELDPLCSLNEKVSIKSKAQQLSSKKYRSLSKSRSLTVNNRYINNGVNLLTDSNSNTQQTSQLALRKRLKSSSKHRSLTKMKLDWIKDRDKEKQKQLTKVHQFDQQKIDRNYDHLGKLRKKTTYNKREIKFQFSSFKNLPHEAIGEIDKQTFQLARKDFNKKFKTYAQPKPQLIPKSIQRQQGLEQQAKTPSPKVVKKNFLKINPLYNMYKKQNKGQRRNFRVSADEHLLRFKPQLGSQPNIINEEDDPFYSEIQQFGLREYQDDLNTKLKRKQTKQIENVSYQEQMNLQRHRVSQNQQTSIFDKVYFFSLKLSTGSASLFTIEKINLKSRPRENFIIEVVICAFEEIMVQKIKFDKNKRFETMKRLKPGNIDKNYQKDKLKSQLFAQLMAKRQEEKNRDSVPVSVEFNSQKTNFQRNSQQHLPFSKIQNFSNHSIEQHYQMNDSCKQQEIPASYQKLSSMNFTKVSPESYQLIIDYLQKFCQLQISYLGVSLKEVDCEGGMLNQLMKKKHSQMQETLLESLNLAKVFYFLIKINATYYVSKSVIIANRKIKHYLLYEFSNMIRHEKDCIIEEEEQMSESVKTMRDKQLVEWLYKKVNRFFTYSVFREWKQQKPLKNKNKDQNSKKDFNSDQYPLINALQMCFGSLANVGMNYQHNQIDSDRLFKIVQSNYRNDVRWKKIQFQFNPLNNSKDQNNTQPFFVHHNAFDFGLTITPHRHFSVLNAFTHSKQPPFLFISPLCQQISSPQPAKSRKIFSYTITRNFQINIILYPSVFKSRDQMVNLHVRRIKQIKIETQFRREQFALLHLEQNLGSNKKSQILDQFLKQQYVNKIIKSTRGFNNISNKVQQHLFTIIKNKKYHIHVYLSEHTNKGSKRNVLQQSLKIQAESRSTVRHYTLQLTFGDILAQIKQYHRLYSDSISYQKFCQAIKRIKTHSYQVTKNLIINRVKFYVSKLLLMKKNTYSQFYFVPLQKMVSQASFKASSAQNQKQTTTQEKSIWGSSVFINQTQKQLIFRTLQKLQDSLQQKQKHSLSTLSKITIKNFPIYQIYYKAVKKLIPGHFVIVSIYYMPMFDLSQVKIYVNRIRKSFWAPVRRDIGSGEYEKIVDGLVQFVKEKFFGHMISKETQKLSSKYRDFYSQMIKQADATFLSKARKTKENSTQNSNLNVNFNSNLSRRRQRQPTRHKSTNPHQFMELTEELLCKLFHSPRRNKYNIRLSYPATDTYVHEGERKGIDELINISVLKQNCMLIYKFQTTARKLLSKKVTHKFNVIQLEYQQKNKPFYILFEEIQTLIKQSDQTTYGLLNTFRGYFLNKHYYNLTTKSFVSMLSLNLLAGVTNKNLSQSKNSLSLLPHDSFSRPHHSNSQNKFNKDLNSTKYQRYCLFVEGSKILQVLKVRDKFQKKTLMQSDRSLPLAKSQTSNISKQFVRRRQDRKQSIEAFLTEKNNFLQTSIKTSQKNSKNGRKYSNNQAKQLDFIVEESYYINQHSGQDEKIETNYEQKIVYLIDTDNEIINEVQSSIQDQGFMINIPFGRYNKKMFKRFFKYLLKVREQNQVHQQICHAISNNNIHSSSVLSVPEVNRPSVRSSQFSSLQTFL